MTSSPQQTSSYDFLICRNQSHNDYQVYRVDAAANELFTPLPLSANASFDATYRMAQIGGYLLQWGPKTTQPDDPKNTPIYHYNLLAFDPTSTDPLNAIPLQTGYWQKQKFWGYRDYYSGNPDEDQNLDLIPMSSFVLNMIPAQGRGTYELWNFDPKPTAPGNADPIPEPYTAQGGLPLIKAGHTLIAIGNYVIDRLPDGKHFRLWSFDPQMHPPLALPAIQQGCWDKIDANHQLTAIGNHVLDWNPKTGTYRLWGFDPEHKNVLVGPIKEGQLPTGIDTSSVLTGYQPKIPVHTENLATPGSLNFMRSKIKHVVYYMVESRSFDNVCGWLYENGDQDCNFIGTDEPFDGASTDDYNYDFKSTGASLDANHPDKGSKVHVSQYEGGKLSDDYNLIAVDQDPFHDTTDALQQMFAQEPGYWGGDKPDMGGFVLNNANPQVMSTFSPEQLPVLNGLAKSFSISDQWFSSVPGGTDVNRAFSVTGSAFNMLGTWEGGNIYKYFPDFPRRQSIWKTLWSQGITDWKIYYSMLWKDAVFTDQLYLQGQIPTVDASPDDYIAPMAQFKQDAANGTLPAFSFLEPFWYKTKGTTSYHPGTDLVPAEVALNEIYEAVKNGPGWDETLLIITFDKNNGTYDHVAPPYAKKAWPNDCNNGFKYDIMGTRVPTIMVSPWIKEQSVFRAEGNVPFDATSFPATLLKWFGVPKAQWGLGDRMDVAPTFEAIFQADAARTDAPTFTPPHDKTYPKKQ